MDLSTLFVKRLEGKGDLNFVLIHNAGGNHHFFVHQIEMLRKYGDLILLDLPGHGKSRGSTCNFQMETLSSIIAQVCKAHSLSNICLVGLNNGADIAIETAFQNIHSLWGMVLIDPPIFMDATFVSEIQEFIDVLQGKSVESFITELVKALFIDTSPDNKKIATKAFLEADPTALQKTFKGLIEWDQYSSGKLKKIEIPTLCVLTDEHHCLYSRLKEEAPHFDYSKVIGSKCWATLEVPEQLNAMIERFIQINS